jgi:hypothetical protein
MRGTFRLVIIPSILGTLLMAAVWVHAQAVRPQAPTIISGPDLGFRVDGRKGNVPVGVLVVRINGQWVEVESGVGVKRLVAR